MNALARSRNDGAPAASGAALELLHDTPSRLRLRYPPGVDPIELQARLESLPGVEQVRVNAPIRSVAVTHEANPRTRAAVLEVLTVLTVLAVPGAARAGIPAAQLQEAARVFATAKIRHANSGTGASFSMYCNLKDYLVTRLNAMLPA